MSTHRRSGFTLIELAAVLVILGLTAAAVSWSLSDRVNVTRLRDVAGELMLRDGLARHHARLTGSPCTLIFDLSKGSIERIEESTHNRDGNAQTEPVVAARYQMPEGFRLTELRLPNSRGRFGQEPIVISDRGLSSDYALHLTDPGGETLWVLVVGVTGRWMLYENKEPIDAIMALLQSERPDPD